MVQFITFRLTQNLQITFISSLEVKTSLGKFTSRPTNTSVLYCIATKNIYLNPSLDYSTDEKIVGTWIDGKPIYQKTIQLTKATSANTWYLTPIGASVDTVVSLKGFCTDNAHYWSFENPMYGDATLPSFYAQNNNETTANIIAFYSTSNAWVGRTLYYATIQYTKTTD